MKTRTKIAIGAFVVITGSLCMPAAGIATGIAVAGSAGVGLGILAGVGAAYIGHRIGKAYKHAFYRKALYGTFSRKQASQSLATLTFKEGSLLDKFMKAAQQQTPSPGQQSPKPPGGFRFRL